MFVQMVLKGYLNDIIQQFANIFPILLGKNQQSIPILVYIIYIIFLILLISLIYKQIYFNIFNL